MNRRSSSQADKGNTVNNGSGVTLKDVHVEANKMIRKALLNDNLKADRKEREIYVSGPFFPCKQYRLKNQELVKKPSFIRNFKSDERNAQAVIEIVIPEISPNKTQSKEVEHEKIGAVKPCGISVNRASVAEVSINSLTKRQLCPTVINEACSKEFQNMKISEDKRKDLPESVQSGTQLEFELSQNVSGTTSECSHQGRLRKDNDIYETLIERKTTPSSASSKRASGQLGPRQTTPLLERRRESCFSIISNKTTRSNHFHTSTDQFVLDNISNPLLRESLRKILNPQSYLDNLDSTPGTETIPLVTSGDGTIFDEEIFLPKIRRRFKYRSLDMEDECKRPGFTNDGLKDKHKKQTIKSAGLVGNQRSLEQSSTRCTGIALTRNHSVRMLSIGPEYAVKGLVGQWLKRRSENAVHSRREKASVAKQEVYREVQLLKVGLSMRMLAGIV